MPQVCEFYGIGIYMYYREHSPPHFHARYAGGKASINIRTGEVMSSQLPGRALRLVRKWHRIHQSELLERWEQARRGEALTPINPLQ
jgi:hypothetical protein